MLKPIASKMLYHIVLVLVMTQAIQIQPGPTRQESDTILDKMRQELTSVFGICSFPPEEVLTNHNAEAFTFLEKCDKKMLNSSSYKDEDTLLCMALFDVGLRICNIGDEATFKSITRFIPHNAVTFQNLLTKGFNPQPDLCTALKDAVVEPQSPLTQKWNFKHVLQKSDKACSRLCYDYTGDENVFCQLILWGSNLLADRSAIGDHSISGYDNIKAADSASPIVENQQVLPGVEQLASKPSVARRLGQPQPNFNERRPAFSYKLINTSQEVNKIDSEHVGLAQQTQSIGTGTGTIVEAAQGMSPSLENSGSVTNGDKSADLSVVQIIESGGSAVRTVQKQLPTSGDMKTDPSHADHKKKLMNSASAGLSSTGTVSKAEPDKATGPSQEDRPTVEKEDSQEVNPQQMSKPSVPQAVSKSGRTSASTASTVDVVPPDVLIPKEGGYAAVNEEPGVEQLENEDQTFQGDDDDDQNLPNGDDIGFEPASKSEALGIEKSFAKQPQEEMTNGNAYGRDRFVDSEDSHFFSYFLVLIGISIIGYLVFHNKQKILALAVEGRARRGNRRRPNTANYHKLDSNLEEAVSSPCNTSSSHVIY